MANLKKPNTGPTDGGTSLQEKKRYQPSTSSMFRKVYENAKKVSHSNQVPKPQLTRYVYHQIGKLEGHLVASGKWYKGNVIQEFITFQQSMENLLPADHSQDIITYA